MTSLEFEQFSRLVSQLWPRWAYVDPKNPDKSNWNQANQANIFQLFKNHDLRPAEAILRKQRQWEPDGTKPEWKPILNELRTQKGNQRSPAEIAADEQAERETMRMRAWGRVNQHRLDEIEREVLRQRPRMRYALNYARKLHAEMRVWVCEQWEMGVRFEEFADGPDEVVEDSPLQSEIPF